MVVRLTGVSPELVGDGVVDGEVDEGVQLRVTDTDGTFSSSGVAPLDGNSSPEFGVDRT